MRGLGGKWTGGAGRRLVLAAILLGLGGAMAPAQAKGGSRISADDARKLFALVDELAKFASNESGLTQKSAVQRRLISRDQVESMLKQKFDEDEGAKRLERSQIVLKKFGLLERDFELKPFLLALLKEQVEAYYDTKEKTVYLLDWVKAEEQKPVLAHELTHALQDQQVNLEKWSDSSPDELPSTASQDNQLLATDEMDTARDAVVEGQATAVMMNYVLKPRGLSLQNNPELIDMLIGQMGGREDSPVLSQAPVMIAESLLFPYREGLRFEQQLWYRQGREAAFAGALARPPRSSWEIYNPQEYARGRVPAVPLLPDVHPLLDKLYKPYDLGQIGQLDLRILAEVYGGPEAAEDLAPFWEGGVYWAGQRRETKSPSTASVALFYLSTWKSPQAARLFAELYLDALDGIFAQVKPVEGRGGDNSWSFETNEGPVYVELRGAQLFLSESFELGLARQLAELSFVAQGSGDWKMAAAPPAFSPASELSRLFSRFGAMRFAARAAERSAAVLAVDGEPR